MRPRNSRDVGPTPGPTTKLARSPLPSPPGAGARPDPVFHPSPPAPALCLGFVGGVGGGGAGGGGVGGEEGRAEAAGVGALLAAPADAAASLRALHLPLTLDLPLTLAT